MENFPSINTVINMAEYIITIFATIVFLVIFTIFMTYYKNSGLKVVEEWAKREGYKILDSELRWVKTGPFFLSGTPVTWRADRFHNNRDNM